MRTPMPMPMPMPMPNTNTNTKTDSPTRNLVDADAYTDSHWRGREIHFVCRPTEVKLVVEVKIQFVRSPFDGIDVPILLPIFARTRRFHALSRNGRAVVTALPWLRPVVAAKNLCKINAIWPYRYRIATPAGVRQMSKEGGTLVVLLSYLSW